MHILHNRVPQVKQDLNNVLPSDMRVHAVSKVPSSFMARNSVIAREYEYILPIGSDITCNTDIDVDLFRKSLDIMSSTHSFHNFTCDREARTLKSQEMIPITSLVTAKQNKRLLRNIFYFSVSNPIMNDPIYYTPHLRITVYGQSFLLHQIRLMIGAALSVATGKRSS